MIKKYRKIPAVAASEVVEAIKFEGADSHWEMAENWSPLIHKYMPKNNTLRIVTTSKPKPGEITRMIDFIANPGEYIVRHTDGRLSLHAAAEFEAQYEEYTEPDQTTA